MVLVADPLLLHDSKVARLGEAGGVSQKLGAADVHR